MLLQGSQEGGDDEDLSLEESPVEEIVGENDCFHKGLDHGVNLRISASLSLSFTLIYRGYGFSLAGSQRKDATDEFRPEKVFLRVRTLCTVLGVKRSNVTESRKWTDIDGNLYNDAVWLKPPFD